MRRLGCDGTIRGGEAGCTCGSPRFIRVRGMVGDGPWPGCGKGCSRRSKSWATGCWAVRRRAGRGGTTRCPQPWRGRSDVIRIRPPASMNSRCSSRMHPRSSACSPPRSTAPTEIRGGGSVVGWVTRCERGRLGSRVFTIVPRSGTVVRHTSCRFRVTGGVAATAASITRNCSPSRWRRRYADGGGTGCLGDGGRRRWGLIVELDSRSRGRSRADPCDHWSGGFVVAADGISTLRCCS